MHEVLAELVQLILAPSSLQLGQGGVGLLLAKLGESLLFPLRLNICHLVRPACSAVRKDNIANSVVFHTKLLLELGRRRVVGFPLVDNSDSLGMRDLLVDVVRVLLHLASLRVGHNYLAFVLIIN